jgi:hypothetical protein
MMAHPNFGKKDILLVENQYTHRHRIYEQISGSWKKRAAHNYYRSGRNFPLVRRGVELKNALDFLQSRCLAIAAHGFFDGEGTSLRYKGSESFA